MGTHHRQKLPSLALGLSISFRRGGVLAWEGAMPGVHLLLRPFPSISLPSPTPLHLQVFSI